MGVGFGESSPKNPYLDRLIQESRRRRLGEHRYWRLLLHYHRGLLGGEKSDVDDKKFFLAQSGRRTAQAELEATLAASFEPAPAKPEEQHPQCRYPARYAWLKERLSFGPDLPEQPCPRFESWRGKLDPESMSLIFASYYLNNPASMYGHTFLRLNRRGHGDDRLLDYTVNFAARTESSSGLAFAILGLSGGYRGVFSTHPYYMKVQQYNNMESRDLWEYPLNLDAEGLERFIRHLWEMGHTSLAYYFLNKNCSYQLLPMLEVARPELRLKERFRFRAIPLDTLRALLAQEGLVSAPNLRPSHVRQMLDARAQLTADEVQLAEEIAEVNGRHSRVSGNPGRKPSVEKSGFPIETFGNDGRQALVLDSAYNYLRYKSGFYRDQPAEVKAKEQEILLLRSQSQRGQVSSIRYSQLGQVSYTGDLTPAPPHAAHNTGRIGLGFGATREEGFEEISVRSAIHDLEEDPTGFVDGSHLEMFKGAVRYANGRGKAYLEDVTLISVKSLTPWDRWVHPPSWKVAGGAAVAKDLGRRPESSLFFGINGGSGLAFRLSFLKRSLLYGMVDADSALGHVFDKGYRLGVGASAGFLLTAGERWRLHFSGGYLRYGAGHIGSNNKLKVVQDFSLRRNLNARLALERQNHYQEGLISLHLYY